MVFNSLAKHFAQTGLTAFITNSSCLEHNMGEGHPECPERITAIKDQLMASQLFDFLQELDSHEATEEQLLRVHPEHYLRYLESVTPTVGTFRVDPDTAICSATLKAAHFAAGAVIDAVDLVAEHKIPNAFCAVRPPGHHAESAKAMGFCFINNVAVGVMHAIAVHKYKRVAIIDFDVHHGNGTEEIFQDDERVMLLSIFQHPFFPYCGDTPKGSNPNIINTPMKSGSRSADFRKVVEDVWLPKLHEFEPEMIFICAGFDAHLEDDMGNFGLVEADYQWVTEHMVQIAALYAHGRIVSVLEGGYDLSSLGRSVVAHIRALTEG